MSDPNSNEPTVPLSQARTVSGPAATSPVPRSLAHLAAGAVISRYRVESVLGEGGMGVVYLARQDKPDREVALKVVRPGYATEKMLRRFEHESEVLGRLLHPGIAQIYEAGTADAGFGPQPFFAMELVKGVSLTRYAAEKKLSTRERLELLAKVCDAVQHAHQKGVIHRDLKPGNILVTEDGQPKILDFGVARATDSDIQQTTMQTDVGAIVGTIPYMSPEQVGGDPDELDTRSDVYALGVIAYELLVGRLPYDLERKMIHEAARIIREDEPTRLSSIDRTLRGDVETIVGHALEKDKARRYSAASALAADIRRYLSDEPIAARPASTWYQLAKFSRRNKGLVGGVAAAFIFLSAGLTFALVSRAEAVAARNSEREARESESEQRKEAQSQRDAAITAKNAEEQQRKTAEAIAKFQTDMLATADPDKLLGDKVTVLQAMQAAVKVLDEGSLKDQPLVEAGVRETIGITLLELARYDDAEPNMRRSLEIRRAVHPAEHPNIATSLGNLALLLKAQNRLAEAEPLFRESLKISRAAHPAGHQFIATGLNNLAELLRAQNKFAEAEPLFSEALGIVRAALPDGHPLIAASLNNLALLLLAQNRLTEAEPLMREALEFRRAAFPVGHPEIAAGLNNLAELLRAQNRLTEAEPLVREALEIRRAALPTGHPEIAEGLNNLALLLEAQNRLAEAEPLVREALEIYRATLPAGHPRIAAGLNNLAGVLFSQNKLAEAEPLFREELRIYRAALPAGHPDIAASLGNLAGLLKQQNKLAEAEPLFREALEVFRAALPAGHPKIATGLNNLAMLLKDQNKPAEAEPLLREALEIRRAALPTGHPAIAIGLNSLGNLLYHQNRFEEAEPLFREALEIRRAAFPAGHPNTLSSLYSLASVLIKAGRPDEAAPLVEESIEEHTKAFGATNQYTRYAIGQAVTLYESWDKAEPGKGYDVKAAEWKAKLDAVTPLPEPAPPPATSPRPDGG